MTIFSSDYTGRNPDGSVILSPDFVGTVETTGRHANRATEEYLTAFFRNCWGREPEDCAVVTIGISCPCPQCQADQAELEESFDGPIFPAV